MTKSSTKALQIYNFRALPYFNNSDGDGDGVGGAVLRVFPCGTYATKTFSSLIHTSIILKVKSFCCRTSMRNVAATIMSISSIFP